MTEETRGQYQIAELAAQAGVTVRTVRFYIDQGLLPPPQTKGRYAYYTEADLARLQLIRRMKDAYLPLQEIRRRLEGLTRAEIVTAAAAAASPLPEPVAPKRVSEAAPRYVAAAPAPPPPAAAPLREDLAPPGAPAADWRRIELAPGVELHLRLPLAAPLARRVDELIHLARQLLRRP
jgi:DNA-binding transcriptional MerR regulator